MKKTVSEFRDLLQSVPPLILSLLMGILFEMPMVAWEPERKLRVIDEERISTFINSLDRGNVPFLDELEKEAALDQVPIIRKDTQALLRFLMNLAKPSNILEIGCAVGFSALLMGCLTALCK